MKEFVLKLNLYKTPIAVFICWLFHINGIFGILYWDKQWFLSNTPLNLSISFGLLIWTLKEFNIKVFLAIIIAFLTGMIAEIIGVNTGVIFGNYWYGENLGIKVWGVPLLIGVNWAILTFIIGSLSAKITNNRFIAIGLGAIIMVLFDFIIEPSAPKFDFWYWENEMIPLKNYIDWLLIALIPQTAYHVFVKEKEHVFSFQLLLAQLIFFGTFFIIL